MVPSHGERVRPSAWAVAATLAVCAGPGRVLWVVRAGGCAAPAAALPSPQGRAPLVALRHGGALAGGGLQSGRGGAYTAPTWETEEGLPGPD